MIVNATIYRYPLTIEKKHLDAFGHVNNAVYLTILEQARWEIINNNGYTIDKIEESGLGPTIIEINIKFLKEILLNDKIIIETQFISYDKKIGRLAHRILRNEEVCSTAEYAIGLFDMRARRLVLPTPEWLKAIGIH